MDFAFLPPEINSGRMYAGPGPASYSAAASSWDSLAAELSTTAESYDSVLSGLSLQWSGPASEAMAAAVAHYVGWAQATAEQAKQTAMQARSAAAAYEQAFASTVPPPAVTANRTQLASLNATNLLGQNTAAIAATEAQYSEFWAQDASAMSGYATSSAAATQLTPFATPQRTTDASGLAAQNTAVAQANASAAADPVSQVISAATQALQSLLANPTAIIPDDLTALDIIAATGTSLNSTYYMEAFAGGVIGAENNLGMLPKAAAAAADVAPVAPALTAAPQLGGGAGLGSVTAVLSGSGTIGAVSVPASWAAPSSGQVAALPPNGFTTIPGTEEAAAAGYPGYPGMPAGTGPRSSGVGAPPRYGVRLTVMGRSPAAG
jgi:PPE-repeat protein